MLPRVVSVQLPSPSLESAALPPPLSPPISALAPHIRSQPRTTLLPPGTRLSSPSSKQPASPMQAGDPRTLFSLMVTSNKRADFPPSFYEDNPCSCDYNCCWFFRTSQDYGPITQLVSFGGGPSASPAQVLIWGSPEAALHICSRPVLPLPLFARGLWED